MGIKEELIWLSLHKALQSHPLVLLRIDEVCDGDVSRLIDLNKAELDELFGEQADKIESALENLEQVRGDWEELKENGVEIILFTDDRYPKKLKQLSEFPPIIYALGNLSLLDDSAIGICGSRDASSDGLKFANRFGFLAAQHNLVEISGFAKGVDTEAHLGSLEADGRTISVLAEGIQNFRLKKVFRQIDDFYERALVISQFYPKHIWQVSRAMTRNKVICGLSEVMVVIEAGKTGGTLAAGRDCLEQKKPLLVVERKNPSDNAPGNLMLIKEGGIPIRSTAELKLALSSISKGSGLEVDKKPKASYDDHNSDGISGQQMALLDRESLNK